MAFIMMHWLASQSLFLVRLMFFRGTDSEVNTMLGFSCIAIIFAIALGLIILLVCIGYGFRRYQGTIPLAMANSLAISAACHRPEDDTNAARLPVMWGEIITEEDSAVGHCCISSHAVCPPTDGRLYAGSQDTNIE